MHEGITHLSDNVEPFLKIIKGNGNDTDGIYDGAIKDNVCGTYFHGIFHNFEFRRQFTDMLRVKKGLDPLGITTDEFKEAKTANYDQLGDLLADNVDMDFFEKLLKEE